MRILVTGATGYLGTAIVSSLVRAGHRVTGLSRAEAKDAVVRRLGAEPLRGRLGALADVVGPMREHDAIIHTAMDYVLGPRADLEAIDAMLLAAHQAGAPRTIVYTSGVWVLGNTRGPASESAPTHRAPDAVAWRRAHERAVIDAGSGDLATAVIRPGMVFGASAGIVSSFFKTAVEGGAAAYVGDGANHWALVHRDDLAELYRLAVEKRARGAFHGVDGASPTLAEAARAASVAAGKGAIRSIPLEEARKGLGPMADALAMDQIVIAPRSAELGWATRHPPFVQDAPNAFREWRAG